MVLETTKPQEDSWGCSNMLYIKQNFSYWKIIAGNALQSSLVDRWTMALFLLGKTVRIGMSLVFLNLVGSQIGNLAGYSGDQLMVFFIIYQLLDTFVQIFFRGVYEFESKVRSGEFDLSLVQPINPLFRSLMGKPDINDAVLFYSTGYNQRDNYL
jgi:ABC-type uncharacterized transport system permease subunit